MRPKAETYIGKVCLRGHEGGVRYAHNGACIKCANESAAKRTKERRKTNPELQLLYSAKQRAKESGWDFDLTADDIEIPSICPVLGTPMVSPSIDRIDSTKGYVKGNICVISWRANKLKQDATLEELRQLVAYVERYQDR